MKSAIFYALHRCMSKLLEKGICSTTRLLNEQWKGIEMRERINR